MIEKLNLQLFAGSYVGLDIYSNDGSELLYSNDEIPIVTTAYPVIVNSDGCECDGDQIYTYSGNKQFLGFSGTANSSTLKYEVGDSFTISENNPETLYIVEGDATTYKHLKIGTTKIQVDSALRDGDGNLISGVYAKKSEIPEGAIIDTALSTTSTNAVRNSVITTKINTMDNTIAGKANSADLASVATSGSYNDLTNTPTIPTISLNNTSTTSPSFYAPTTGGSSGYLLKSNGSNTAPTWASASTLGIALTSDLSAVATSGSYNDLSDKPTIPTVNDATLTIQKNGTTVDTFTANSSTDKTINITVPTNNNELTNGAGYLTRYISKAGYTNTTDVPSYSNALNSLVLQTAKNGDNKTYSPTIGFVESGTSDSVLFMRNRNLCIASTSTNSDIPAANTAYKLMHEGNVGNYVAKKVDFTLTGGNGNTTGYRLVYSDTLGAWSIKRVSLAISSRHQGTGILNFAIDVKSTIDNYSVSLEFTGNTLSMDYDSWFYTYDSSTGAVALYWKYRDNSPCACRILSTHAIYYSSLSNGGWTETLPSNVTYVTINKAERDGDGNVITSTYAKKDLSNVTSEVYSFCEDEYNKTSNLLNIPDISERTVNGVTYTVSNGIITLNGTPTSNFNLVIPVQANIEPNTDYIFKNYSAWNSCWQIMLLNYTDSGFKQIGYDTFDLSFTTSETDNRIIEYRFWLVTSATYTNNQIKPMLIKGTTAPSSFEAYNGDIVHEKDLPTNNNQLTNGAGYITSSSLSGYYTKTESDGRYIRQVQVFPSKSDGEVKVGKWRGIDLYAKSYTFSPTSPSWYVFGTVSNSYTTVDYNGFLVDSDGGIRKIGASEYPNGGEITRVIVTDTGDAAVQTSANGYANGSTKWYVTIYYVKTRSINV